jgi:hypothetical protein
MAKTVVAQRTEMSPLPYITYCTNCRDIFAKDGKPAVHLLDLLFDLNLIERTPPTWTKRRPNREELKRNMEKTLWHRRNRTQRTRGKALHPGRNEEEP